MKDLLAETAARSVRYSAAAGNMRVAPQPRNVARLEALGGALPQNPSDPAEVLALLDDVGSPAGGSSARQDIGARGSGQPLTCCGMPSRSYGSGEACADLAGSSLVDSPLPSSGSEQQDDITLVIARSLA